MLPAAKPTPTQPPRQIDCPACEGAGEHLIGVVFPAEERWRDCAGCGGAGRVPDPEEYPADRCDHATTGCWLPCLCGHRCDDHGVVAGAPCGLPGCACEAYRPIAAVRCACGCELSAAQWPSLKLVGMQEDGAGGWLELRDCPVCKSTLAIPRDPVDAKAVAA